MNITKLGLKSNDEGLLQKLLKTYNVGEEWLKADEKSLPTLENYKGYEEAKTFFEEIISMESPVITLYIDSDSDGIFSASIMYKYLKLRNPDVRIHLTTPHEKSHDICVNQIPLDSDLIIISDSGTNSIEECRELIKLCPIIVIDHHQVVEKNEFISALINPYQEDCTGNKAMCGAGLTWAFINTLEGGQYPLDLDLAAAGTLADRMDVTNIENKALINCGLNKVAENFLKSILENDARISGSVLTPTLIEFYIAPLINALTRVGNSEDRFNLVKGIAGESCISHITLFKSMESFRGKQNREKDKEYVELIMQLQKRNREANKVLIFERKSRCLNTTSGLVASKLSDGYKKPVLVGKINEEGEFKGSIRSPYPGFKEFCEETGLFEFVAGHSQACGFGIKKENIAKFEEYANEHYSVPEYEDTVEFNLEDITNEEEFLNLVEYWSNKIACGEIKPLRVYGKMDNNYQVLGAKQNTIKWITPRVDLIKFFTKEDEVLEYTEIEFVGKLSINQFNGKRSLQVIVEKILN